MAALLRFFSRNGLFIFFILLEAISLVLIFSQNSLQKTFLARQTTAISSWIAEYVDEGVSYLKLKEVNNDLTKQNRMLLQQLYGKDFSSRAVLRKVVDTSGAGQTYTFIDGEIVNNSINRRDNYFTINRGRNHGIEPKMGVISPQGIAGIVINTTPKYALVQSVLSVNKMKINASHKNSGYFGTLIWKGEDARVMHLTDIPKYVPINVGDTITTDGKSAIFPRGIIVGRVAGYHVDPKTGFWDISVELSQKMGNLQKVFVVNNLKKEQIKQIQDSLDITLKNDQ